MNKQELIEKYETMLKTIREVITKSDLNEDTLTAQGCERFVKGFLEDLRTLEKLPDPVEISREELQAKIEKVIDRYAECSIGVLAEKIVEAITEIVEPPKEG
jgi:hypothetical protein